MWPLRFFLFSTGNEARDAPLASARNRLTLQRGGRRQQRKTDKQQYAKQQPSQDFSRGTGGPTQPPIISGMGNEYRSMGNALRPRR